MVYFGVKERGLGCVYRFGSDECIDGWMGGWIEGDDDHSDDDGGSGGKCGWLGYIAVCSGVSMACHMDDYSIWLYSSNNNNNIYIIIIILLYNHNRIIK